LLSRTIISANTWGQPEKGDQHAWNLIFVSSKLNMVCMLLQDPKGLSIRRDGAFMILSLGKTFQVSEYTGLPAGLYCNILKGDKCSQDSAIRVGPDGKAVFRIQDQDAIAITKANKPSNDVA
jgi:hypothetical protein